MCFNNNDITMNANFRGVAADAQAIWDDQRPIISCRERKASFNSPIRRISRSRTVPEPHDLLDNLLLLVF